MLTEKFVKLWFDTPEKLPEASFVHPGVVFAAQLQKCFVKYVIGASLSKPHTSVTAVQKLCVCMYVRTYVCMSACGHIP